MKYKILLLVVASTLIAIMSYCQSIEINSTIKRPLNKNLFNASVVDIFYNGQATSPRMRDILAQPYSGLVDSLHLTGVQYSGTSTADHDQVIVGDSIVYGGHGHGYNCTDCADLDGICCSYIPKDFFNEFTYFARAKHYRVSIIANVQTGTWAQLKWKIQRTHASVVFGGGEENLTVNSSIFPDGNSYCAKWNAWCDSITKYFPGVQTVTDAPPIFKITKRNSDFTTAATKSKSQWVRIYAWDNDLIPPCGDSWSTNLAQVNLAFTNTFPAWLASYQLQYPGRKFPVMQWGIKNQDGATTGLIGTVLGSMYLVKEMNCFLDHDDVITYASFMSLKTLIGSDNSCNALYFPIEKIGDFFNSGDTIVQMNIINVPGVTGHAAVRKGKYVLLLTNDNNVAVTIPKIVINSKTMSSIAVTTENLYGTSLGSTAFYFDAIASKGSFKLQPFSVAVVKF